MPKHYIFDKISDKKKPFEDISSGFKIRFWPHSDALNRLRKPLYKNVEKKDENVITTLKKVSLLPLLLLHCVFECGFAAANAIDATRQRVKAAVLFGWFEGPVQITHDIVLACFWKVVSL